MAGRMNTLFFHVLMTILLYVFFCRVHANADSETDFVQVKDGHFNIDGKAVYLSGFNAYWLMFKAAEASEKSEVQQVLHQAAYHGLTVARTWAFNDGGYRALQLSPGVYDENVFKALDFVVNEAKLHGIRLILSLVNNNNNFGGKAQYVKWANIPGGKDDDFYTNPTVKDYYRNHIKRVLTRVNSISGIAYRDDPTIFAWELMNEPRCVTDPSGNTLQRWIEEMSGYVKSIDGKHLLEIGLEGFYGDSTPEKKRAINPNGFELGTDFIRHNQLQTIDFATVHSYPDIWLSGEGNEEQLGFLQRWVDNHIEDSGRRLKKPVLFAEFGKSSRDAGYEISERNSLFEIIYKGIRGGGGAGGALFWQLFATGMEGDALADGYQVILSNNSSTTSLIYSQSLRLHRLSI